MGLKEEEETAVTASWRGPTDRGCSLQSLSQPVVMTSGRKQGEYIALTLYPSLPPVFALRSTEPII